LTSLNLMINSSKTPLKDNLQTKIAVIGWDSATFEIINPLIRSGVLPNIAQLMQTGKFGTLKSTIHPISPTAWSSFITGVNPGKHGIYNFVGFDTESNFQFANGGAIKSKSLWSYLSQADKKSLIVNVPMTYPPEEINGLIISGMDSPNSDQPYTFPVSLARSIKEKYPNYRNEVKVKRKLWSRKRDFLENYIDELCEMTAIHSSIVCDQLSTNSFDFLSVVFTATDRIQHVLGKLIGNVSPNDGIGKVYQACDQALGQILNNLEGDWNILLMSDHGSAPYSRVFELNTWLEQNKWIQFKQTKTGLFQRFTNQRWWISTAIRRYLKLNSFDNKYLDRIEWSKTKAFSMGAFGCIFINTTKRFPKGLISETDRESVRNTLINNLLSLIDPSTGKEVIKRIYKSEELYSGPFVTLGPDLIIETTEDYFIRNNLDHTQGQLFYNSGPYQNRSLNHTGKHTRNGILIAKGPLFSPNKIHNDAEIIDLAPTILYLFGLLIPKGLDGEVLLGWLDPYFIHNNLPIRVSTEDWIAKHSILYSKQEQSLVEDRLKDLGYF